MNPKDIFEEFFDYNVPKPAGWWIIGKGWHNAVYQKPNRFHRFMIKLLLGWEWIDSE